MPWISKSEREYLEREIVYWRGRADEERIRADRLTDQLLARVGETPVTLEGRDEYRAAQEKLARAQVEIQQQMAEISQDSIEIDPEGDLPSPEQVAATINQYLS